MTKSIPPKVALMAISNIVSWRMILGESESSVSELRSVVWKLSLFYMLWALFNKYLGGNPNEQGHISFCLLTVNCWVVNHSAMPLVFSSILVTLNFVVVVPLILSMGGIRAVARRAWKVKTPEGKQTAAIEKMIDIWAYSFFTYILSNIALWSYCDYLFYTLPLV